MTFGSRLFTSTASPYSVIVSYLPTYICPMFGFVFGHDDAYVLVLYLWRVKLCLEVKP